MNPCPTRTRRSSASTSNAGVLSAGRSGFERTVPVRTAVLGTILSSITLMSRRRFRTTCGAGRRLARRLSSRSAKFSATPATSRRHRGGERRHPFHMGPTAAIPAEDVGVPTAPRRTGPRRRRTGRDGEQRGCPTRRHPISGALAHLEERLPCKQEVAGSSPAGSTIYTHEAEWRGAALSTQRKRDRYPSWVP